MPLGEIACQVPLRFGFRVSPVVGPIGKSVPVSIVKTEPVGAVDRRLILPRFLPAGLFETVFFRVSFPQGFSKLFPSRFPSVSCSRIRD